MTPKRCDSLLINPSLCCLITQLQLFESKQFIKSSAKSKHPMEGFWANCITATCTVAVQRSDAHAHVSEGYSVSPHQQNASYCKLFLCRRQPWRLKHHVLRLTLTFVPFLCKRYFRNAWREYSLILPLCEKHFFFVTA